MGIRTQAGVRAKGIVKSIYPQAQYNPITGQITAGARQLTSKFDKLQEPAAWADALTFIAYGHDLFAEGPAIDPNPCFALYPVKQDGKLVAQA